MCIDITQQVEDGERENRGRKEMAIYSIKSYQTDSFGMSVLSLASERRLYTNLIGLVSTTQHHLAVISCFRVVFSTAKTNMFLVDDNEQRPTTFRCR